jgi:hypothetical protein
MFNARSFPGTLLILKKTQMSIRVMLSLLGLCPIGRSENLVGEFATCAMSAKLHFFHMRILAYSVAKVNVLKL